MRATGNKEGSRELHAHGAAAQRSAKRAKTLSKRHHHEAQKSHAQHKDKKRKRKHHRGHHRVGSDGCFTRPCPGSRIHINTGRQPC